MARLLTPRELTIAALSAVANTLPDDMVGMTSDMWEGITGKPLPDSRGGIWISSAEYTALILARIEIAKMEDC